MVHALFYVFLILLVRIQNSKVGIEPSEDEKLRILIGVSLSVFIRVMENQNTAERRKNHELRFNKSYEIIRNIIDRLEIEHHELSAKIYF